MLRVGGRTSYTRDHQPYPGPVVSHYPKVNWRDKGRVTEWDEEGHRFHGFICRRDQKRHFIEDRGLLSPRSLRNIVISWLETKVGVRYAGTRCHGPLG